MDAPELRFCVLVPVFDNARTVGDVVRGARALGHEVLCVDDGSTDGSGDRAREAGAAVVRLPANRGKGAALRAGFAEALARGFTHAVAIDADGQHFPEDVPALVEAARAEPDALVIGARVFAGTANVPGKSSFGRSFSNFWVFVEGGVRVSDSQCGLRVYPLAHVTRLPLRCERFDLEVEVIVRAAWAGLPVLSVPVRVHYPPPGERVSHFDVRLDNVRISLLNTRLFARRLVPWPHRKLVRSPPRSLRQRLHDLAAENATPHGLGAAVAVGVVVGTSPFFGVQSALALLVAGVFRLNKLATLLGSLVTTPPLTVPIVGASLAVGQLLLHGRLRWPATVPSSWAEVRPLFLQWLVGGLVLGGALGALLGAATALVVARIRARRGAPSPG